MWAWPFTLPTSMFFSMVLLFGTLDVAASAPDVIICTKPDYGFFESIQVEAGYDGVTSIDALVLETGRGYVTMEDKADSVGFDVDLREQLFSDIKTKYELSLSYEVRVYSSYAEVFLRTRNGECDVGWSPYYAKAYRERCTRANFNSKTCLYFNSSDINTTSGSILTPFPESIRRINDNYRCCTDFGPNYFPLGLSLLYKKPKASQVDISRALLEALSGDSIVWKFGMLLSLIIVAGHIIWYVESEANKDEFNPRYILGVGDGMWWSIVTLTTVGYGDKTPRSGKGQFFAALWMLLSFLIGAIILAEIVAKVQNVIETDSTGSTSLATSWSTYGEICMQNKYPDCVVCTYEGEINYIEDTVADVAAGAPISTMKGTDFATCAKLLETGEATAMFMDAPIIAKGISTPAYSWIAEGFYLTPPFYRQETSFIVPEETKQFGRFTSQQRGDVFGFQNQTLLELLSDVLLEFQTDSRTDYLTIVSNHFPRSMLEGSTLSDATDDAADDDNGSESFSSKESKLILLVPCIWFWAYFCLLYAVPFFLRLRQGGGSASEPSVSVSEAALLAAFNDLDIDNSGTIDEKELQPLLEQILKRRVPHKAIVAYIKSVNRSRDGVLQFDEFLDLVRHFEERPTGSHLQDVLSKHLVRNITATNKIEPEDSSAALSSRAETSSRPIPPPAQCGFSDEDRTMLSRIDEKLQSLQKRA